MHQNPNWTKRILQIAILAALAWSGSLQSAPPPRLIPQPLPSHPGHIFLAGEDIVITLPPQNIGSWRVVDYEGNTVKEIQPQSGPANIGRLPVGYYEMVPGGGAVGRFSLEVIERLRAPTPLTSPIGIDVAMAWLCPAERMEAVANLCALAGMNRVRDRLAWGEMEPRRGEFASTNRYDQSLRVQSDAGLQILDVNHQSPAWANPNGQRFPLDLRDAYNFYRAMARRWRGQIVAFEPWNEADISVFGGHTGSEMASLQKAAFLGLKEGNPKLTVCLNVFAKHRAATLSDFQDNAAWGYFDTFNLHHYEPFTNYSRLYADFRAVSAGKPLWVTECSLPVHWSGDSQLMEPTTEDLRLQSERVAITYSLAIHEGAQAVFYFVLPHYVEHQTQFGLLRPDLTPRPAFVALAAAGRLLADAKPLGRIENKSSSSSCENKCGSIHGYVFDSKPDGKREKVLVIWSDTNATFDLPKLPKASFDHLGRPAAASGKTLRLTPAPLYVILDRGTSLPMLPPPATPPRLPGKPAPVVFQALLPEKSVLVNQSAYTIHAGEATSVPVFIYNFSERTVRGRLCVKAPEQWQADWPAEVEIAPGDRQELPLRLTCVTTNAPPQPQVRLTGDFGRQGQAVLSLRFDPK